MYIHKTFKGINSIEHGYSFVGQYGRMGEKRAKRKKATPEQMARQNQFNKENMIRRLIKANFYPNDLWICLKYPKGTRKDMVSFKKDFNSFIRRMKNDYSKRGEELKYIYRLEIGKRGGLHVHLIVNRIWGTDLLCQKNWSGGLCDFTPMYQKGDYRALAAYIAKPLPTTDENFEQLNLFDDFSQKEIKQLAKYGRSRNLVVPEPEVKKYVKRTMKNIIENGPKAREGYYIDKDSIRMGINPINGLSYVYYTEVKQKQEMRPIRYIPEENINKSKRKRREVS